MSRYMERDRGMSMRGYRQTPPEKVVKEVLDDKVSNIDPPPRSPYQYRENIINQKAILEKLFEIVNKSLPVLRIPGKIIQAVIDYYRDPTEEKLKIILFNLVQRIPPEYQSLHATTRFITLSQDYNGVVRYIDTTDQMGGSKDKQKRHKKLRKKRTHKKGKRTQRK